jgi:phage terminase small subunit
MPYKHARIGEGGKKEQRQNAAEKVAGRFSAGTPPKLVAAGGRKV